MTYGLKLEQIDINNKTIQNSLINKILEVKIPPLQDTEINDPYKKYYIQCASESRLTSMNLLFKRNNKDLLSFVGIELNQPFTTNN